MSQLSGADGSKEATWSIPSCNLTCIMQLGLRSTAVYNHGLVLFLCHGNAQGGHCAFLDKSLEACSCQEPDTESSCQLFAPLQLLDTKVTVSSQVTQRFLGLKVSLPADVLFCSFICIFDFYRSVTQSLKQKIRNKKKKRKKLDAVLQLQYSFCCYIAVVSNKYIMWYFKNCSCQGSTLYYCYCSWFCTQMKFSTYTLLAIPCRTSSNSQTRTRISIFSVSSELHKAHIQHPFSFIGIMAWTACSFLIFLF